MAALTDLSDLVNRRTGGNSGTPEDIFFYKDSRVDAAAAVATIAGRYTSLWQYEGCPSGGAAPGAVAEPLETTTGGLLQTDPGGGRTKWLLGMTAAASVAGTLILYDRLLHISGLSGTNTGAQTVAGTLVGHRLLVPVKAGVSGKTYRVKVQLDLSDGFNRPIDYFDLVIE